jgi:vancomycin resistance protein YoaR
LLDSDALRAEAGARPVRRDRRARTSGRGRLVRIWGKVSLAVLLALGILALIGGIVFAGSGDHIAAGVTVSGLKVGGLTPEEAQAKLEATAERYASVPVVFTAAERRFKLRPAALDVEADWAAAAQEAVDRGDALLPIRGLQRVWLRLTGSEVEPTADVFEAVLNDRVSRIATAVDRPAREASLALNGMEPEIVPGQAGRTLDREAAAGAMVAALAGFDRSEQQLPVVVDAPEVTSDALAPVARQLRVVLSAPVRLTYNGAGFTFAPDQMARLLALPANGETQLRINQEIAARRLDNIARGLARAPQNADFAVRGNGRVRVVPSRPGRELNLAATSSALLRAASSPTNRVAAIVVAEFEPRLTTAEAQALRVERQLASYSTLYAGTADRINNLQLAIEILDGARIAPGETWSFNEFVGPRTAERGFRSAPVIMDGKYEEGIGGGVSQVATTVFNAAWEAGIKIGERHAHALYISRYPDGRDATVNYPDVDLKLINDTPRWIVLKGSYDESGIVVRLLGGGPERRVESVAGELKVTGPPETEREPDPTLYVGDRLVEFAGEPSREIRVERIVYQGGDVLYRESWYTHYQDEAKIVRTGTKPRPVEPAPPTEEKKDDEEPPPKDGEGGGGGGGGGGNGASLRSGR